MNPSDHLRPETVFGYEHRLLTPEELRSVHDHVSVCDACRAALARQAGLDDVVSVDPFRLRSGAPESGHFLRYAAAAAVVLIAAGATWMVRHRTEPEVVQEALRARKITLPPFLDQLAPAHQVLMGEPAASGPALISPKATAVLGPSVRFEWQAENAGWTYQVHVFSLSGEPAATSPPIREPQWMCDLPPGSDYQWQVTAVNGAERITLPPPSETPPRFRVLDPIAANRLRDLARKHPDAHLLLGVEYGQAGLIDDARRELTEASRLDPKQTAIVDLLRSIGAK